MESIRSLKKSHSLSRRNQEENSKTEEKELENRF
jgi:hypothetical protein